MSNKPKRFSSNLVTRGLTASLAGLRAGGALAIDSAIHKALGKDKDNSHSAFAAQEADRLVAELGKLKGTYVKVGQMMAMFGEHFLPPVLTQALHKLDDKTNPLDWEQLEEAVKQQLGNQYSELDIDKNALAAASLAQVHRAKIKSTGEDICLKIQYPGLASVIDKEFDAVIRMMTITRFLKRGGDLDTWLSDIRDMLHNEIDYQREMALTLKMERLLKRETLKNQLPTPVRIPEIHLEYSSDALIAMEYIEGQSLSMIDVSSLNLERRNALAKTMLELFFKEVFEWGIIQTDPNFGNYLLTLSNPGSDHADILTLLDYGSAIELTAGEQQYLRDVIYGGLNEDQERIRRGLIGLGWLTENSAQQACDTFSKFCKHLLEPLHKPETLDAQYLNEHGEYRWHNSQLMERAGKKGAKQSLSLHFTPPSGSFTLIARKLAGLFTFITVLEAEFNGYDIARRYEDAS